MPSDLTLSLKGKVALQRVETILLSSKKNVKSDTNLANFLKTYVLGLISTINDMLQDVQGKKTVEMKRKIIRSLGALVHEIGESIVNVAPQVSRSCLTSPRSLILAIGYGYFPNNGWHSRALGSHP